MKNLSPKALIASALLTAAPIFANSITLEQAISIAASDELPSSDLKAEIVAKNIGHLSADALETLAYIVGQLELAQNKALRTYFYEIFHPFFEGQKVSEAEIAAFKSNLSELTTDTELAAQMALTADAFCSISKTKKSSPSLIKALAIGTGSILGLLAVYVLVNKYKRSNKSPENPKESGKLTVSPRSSSSKTTKHRAAASLTKPTQTPVDNPVITEAETKSSDSPDEKAVNYAASTGSEIEEKIPTTATAPQIPQRSIAEDTLDSESGAERVSFAASASAVTSVYGPLYFPGGSAAATKTPTRKRPPLSLQDAIAELQSRDPKSKVTISLSQKAKEDETPARVLTPNDVIPFSLSPEAALPDAPSTGVPTNGIPLPFANGPSTLTAKEAIEELQKHSSNTPGGLTVAIVGQSDEDNDDGYSGDDESNDSDQEEKNRDFSPLKSPEGVVNASVIRASAPRAVRNERTPNSQRSRSLPPYSRGSLDNNESGFLNTPGGSAPKHNPFTDSEPDTTFNLSGVSATPLTEKAGLRLRTGKNTDGDTDQTKGGESSLDDSGFKGDLNTAMFGLD